MIMEEQNTDTLILQVKGTIYDKNKIIEEMRKLVLIKDQKVLDFTKTNTNGYIEYIEGMFIRNVTSPLQHILGATFFHVDIKKDVTFQLHEHESQFQVIYIICGSMTDMTSNKEYKASDLYVVDKKALHLIEYKKGTEAWIIYLPNLNTLDNDFIKGSV